jgi:uroporphyrinogen-III synthase
MPVPSLRGFTVGVTADRRGEEQALMFRRLDLDVVHAPVMKTVPVSHDGRLRAATEALIADPPDYLVANTGLGMRSWWGQLAGWGLEEGLFAALDGHTRIAARGPKAVGATRMIGLEIWQRAPDEQLATVGRQLLAEGVDGCRVAVQLHGEDRQDLTEVLRAAGAEVIELPVYRWTLPSDDQPAFDLIEGCCRGSVDALTFTAGPQIRNLMTLARSVGLADALISACAGDDLLVACIGPVCAAVAVEEGLVDVAVPEHWRLGSMVRMVAEKLEGRRRLVRLDGRDAILQGSVAVVDGEEVRLDDDRRSALRALYAADPHAADLYAADLHAAGAYPGGGAEHR